MIRRANEAVSFSSICITEPEALADLPTFPCLQKTWGRSPCLACKQNNPAGQACGISESHRTQAKQSEAASKSMRRAFSLLEVIIATAILAGSAMVLFSLISLGTKYGRRAEERTIAIAQAQSILDEFIARMSSHDLPEEVNGVLPSNPPRKFRINVTPFELKANQGANRNTVAAMEIQIVLFRVHVKLYESSAQLGTEDFAPLVEISRLVRRPRINEPMAGAHGNPSNRAGAL